MADFPWEIIKAETLRLLSRELGIKRTMKREEVITFLRAVQKNGLGPALADEIVKDFTNSNQSQYTSNQKDTNERVIPSLHSSPAATRSNRTAVSPRRISTRKRPHPESDPLFIPDSSGNSNIQEGDGDEDAEGETDREELESISTAMRRGARRGRGVKRVRLSEPGSGSVRATRSKKDKDTGLSTSISAADTPGRTRTSPRQKPAVDEAGGQSESASGRRTTRTSKRQSLVEEKEEVEEEADDDDDDDDDDEGREEQQERYSGPEGLAVALTRASRESRTARVHDSTTSSATQARPKPRPVIASRGRPSLSRSTRSADVPRASKRAAKPTVKAALLSPNKKPMSILSRPISSRHKMQTQTTKKARGKKVLDGVVMPPPSSTNKRRDYLSMNGRSESPREIFDGVVLPRPRPVRQGENGNNVGNHDLSMHLDEFVANGLGRAMNEDSQNPDPVLDRDEASSLGGSNKENDFSFRNDVSDSTDGPEDRLPAGDEDAEGEPEPETSTAMDNELHVQAQSPAPARAEQPNAEVNVQRSPLHEVLLPQSEDQLALALDNEPQLEPQVQPETAPEPEVTSQTV